MTFKAEYIRVDNGQPLLNQITTSSSCPEGYERVYRCPCPEYNPFTEYLEEHYTRDNNAVTITWQVAQKDPSTIIADARTIATHGVASLFFAGIGATTNTRYLVTVHNATMQQDTSHIYTSGDFLAKVSLTTGRVVELYKRNVVYDGTSYAYASLTLDTLEVIELYSENSSTLTKHTRDGSTTITHYGGYNTIPPHLQRNLAHFNHCNRITQWSEKPYGFIVEYIHPSYTHTNVCTQWHVR